MANAADMAQLVPQIENNSEDEEEEEEDEDVERKRRQREEREDSPDIFHMGATVKKVKTPGSLLLLINC